MCMFVFLVYLSHFEFRFMFINLTCFSEKFIYTSCLWFLFWLRNSSYHNSKKNQELQASLELSSQQKKEEKKKLNPYAYATHTSNLFKTISRI